MSRIIALDYGTKRTGVAVTDPLQIIATPLTTVHSKDLIVFLKEYHAAETIIRFVIGLPKTLENNDSENARHVRSFIHLLKKSFGDIPIETIDERFTTSLAMDALIRGGMKKKDRQDKGRLDKVSATLILQSYLQRRG